MSDTEYDELMEVKDKWASQAVVLDEKLRKALTLMKRLVQGARHVDMKEHFVKKDDLLAIEEFVRTTNANFYEP